MNHLEAKYLKRFARHFPGMECSAISGYNMLSDHTIYSFRVSDGVKAHVFNLPYPDIIAAELGIDLFALADQAAEAIKAELAK